MQARIIDEYDGKEFSLVSRATIISFSFANSEMETCKLNFQIQDQITELLALLPLRELEISLYVKEEEDRLPVHITLSRALPLPLAV